MTFNINAQVRLLPPTNAAQIAAQLRAQLQGISINVGVNIPGNTRRQINNVNSALSKTKASAKDAGNAMSDFGKQAALAGKRFFAFSIATTAIIRFAGALRQGIGDTISFQRELIKIAQVTGNTITGLQDLTKEITRLSTTLGVNSNQLLKASRILAQTGLTAKQTEIALQALAKSDLAPTFDDIISTTEGSIAIFRQFGLEANQLEGALGSINAVAGKFAVESSDIISAVRRTGGAFAAAGGNLNELIALFTSVRATTRESAESIATGFRTIFTRLQRVRTQDFLSSLGIDLRGTVDGIEDQFVGPLEAIRRLSTALKDLPSTDPRFAQIIEELGGFRQISKVIPLIQQFEITEKALGVATAGTTSLTRDAITAQDALAVQIAKVREEFSALIRNFTNNSSFKGIVTIMLSLARALIKVADALEPLTPVIGTLGFIAGARLLPSIVSGFRGAGGFGFTGLTGRHEGGIYKFASGGLVPGTGNKDTVPAKLTPGEYVLRKSAVQRIGEENLQHLNTGGPAYGGVYLFGDLRTKKRGGNQPKGIRGDTLQSNVIKTLLDRGVSLDEYDLLYREKPIDDWSAWGKSEIAVQEFSGSLRRDMRGKFAENVRIRTKAMMRKAAKEITGGVGKVVNQRFVNGLETIQGIVFEGAMTRLGEPFDATMTDDDRPMDFPKGIPAALGQSIENHGQLMGIPVDAKRQESDAARTSIKKKYFAELADNLKTGQSYQGFSVKKKEVAKAPVQRAAAGGMAQLPNAMLTPGEFVVSKEDAARIGEDRLDYINRTGAIPGMAGGGSYGRMFKPKLMGRGLATGNVGRQKQYIDQLIEYLEKGMIQGLLGPAEQRMLRELKTRKAYIREDRSRRFNKRFSLMSKGGAYGKIRSLPKFATGGSVDASSSRVGVAQIGFAIAGISALINQIDGLSDSFKQAANIVTGVVGQFALLYTGIKTTAGFFGKFDENIAQAKKNLEDLKPAGRREALRVQRGTRTLTAIDNRIAAQRQAQQPVSQDLIDRRNRVQRVLSARKSRLQDINARRYEQREAIYEQKGLIKATQAAAIGLGAVAAIANVVASQLEKIGRADIERGGRGGALVASRATSAGVTGALAGAGIGAALAPFTGGLSIPAGLLIGAGIGAVGGVGVGAYQGVSEAGNLRITTAFNKDLEQVGRLFKNISEGLTTYDIQQARLLNTINDTRNRLYGASATVAQDVRANFAQQADNYDQLLRSIAKTSSTFEEFSSQLGTGTFENFANLIGVSTAELRRTFTEYIAKVNEAKDIQLEANQAAEEFANNIRNIVNLSRAFNDVTDSMRRFSVDAESLLSFAQGGTGVVGVMDQSARIADPSQFVDSAEFARIIGTNIIESEALQGRNRDATQTIGEEFGRSVIDARQAVQDLPGILLNLRNGIGSFDGDKAVTELVKQFDTSGDLVRNAIQVAANNIIGPEGQEEKLIDALNNDLPGTTEKISAAFKQQFEIAAQIVKANQEEKNRRLKFVDDFVKLTQDEIALRGRRLQNLRAVEDIRARAQNRPIDLDHLQAIEDQRRANLGVTGGPAEIAARLQTAQNRLREISLRYDKEKLKSDDALLKEKEKLKDTVAKSQNALEFFADANERSAVLLAKIDRERKLPSLKQGFIERAAGATNPEEAFGFFKELRAQRVAATTGTVFSVDPQFRRGVLDFFKNAGDDITFKQFGNQTGTQIFEGLLEDFVRRAYPDMSPDLAKKLAQGGSSEIDRLNTALNKVLRDSATAFDGKIDALEGIIKELGKTLDTSINTFSARLGSLIAQQQIVEQKRKLAGEEGTVAARETAVANLESFVGRLQTGDVAQDETQAVLIGRNLRELREIALLQQRQSDLSGFLDEITTLDSLNAADSTGALATAIRSGGVLARGAFEAGLTAPEFMARKRELGDLIFAATQDADLASAFTDSLDKAAEASFGTMFERWVTGVDPENTALSLDNLQKLIIEALRSTAATTNRDFFRLEDRLADLGRNIYGPEGGEISQQFLQQLIQEDYFNELNKQFGTFKGLLKEGVGLKELAYELVTFRDAVQATRNVINNLEGVAKSDVKQQRGGIIGFNKGGVVPGIGNTDSVLAALTPGEIVLPKMARGGKLTREEYLRKKEQRREQYLAGKKSRRDAYEQSRGIKPETDFDKQKKREFNKRRAEALAAGSLTGASYVQEAGEIISDTATGMTTGVLGSATDLVDRATAGITGLFRVAGNVGAAAAEQIPKGPAPMVPPDRPKEAAATAATTVDTGDMGGGYARSFYPPGTPSPTALPPDVAAIVTRAMPDSPEEEGRKLKFATDNPALVKMATEFPGGMAAGMLATGSITGMPPLSDADKQRLDRRRELDTLFTESMGRLPTTVYSQDKIKQHLYDELQKAGEQLSAYDKSTLDVFAMAEADNRERNKHPVQQAMEDAAYRMKRRMAEMYKNAEKQAAGIGDIPDATIKEIKDQAEFGIGYLKPDDPRLPIIARLREAGRITDREFENIQGDIERERQRISLSGRFLQDVYAGADDEVTKKYLERLYPSVAPDVARKLVFRGTNKGLGIASNRDEGVPDDINFEKMQEVFGLNEAQVRSAIGAKLAYDQEDRDIPVVRQLVDAANFVTGVLTPKSLEKYTTIPQPMVDRGSLIGRTADVFDIGKGGANLAINTRTIPGLLAGMSLEDQIRSGYASEAMFGLGDVAEFTASAPAIGSGFKLAGGTLKSTGNLLSGIFGKGGSFRSFLYRRSASVRRGVNEARAPSTAGAPRTLPYGLGVPEAYATRATQPLSRTAQAVKTLTQTEDAARVALANASARAKDFLVTVTEKAAEYNQRFNVAPGQAITDRLVGRSLFNPNAPRTLLGAIDDQLVGAGINIQRVFRGALPSATQGAKNIGFGLGQTGRELVGAGRQAFGVLGRGKVKPVPSPKLPVQGPKTLEEVLKGMTPAEQRAYKIQIGYYQGPAGSVRTSGNGPLSYVKAEQDVIEDEIRELTFQLLRNRKYNAPGPKVQGSPSVTARLQEEFERANIRKELLPEEVVVKRTTAGMQQYADDLTIKSNTGGVAIYDPKGKLPANRIAIRQGASEQTAFHEAGHIIDRKRALEAGGNIRLMSDTPAVRKILDPLRNKLEKVIADQKAMGNLPGYDAEFTEYVLRHRELLAELTGEILSGRGNYFTSLVRKAVGFQTGAFVPGIGSGDKVRALLEPGEYVLNRNAVKAVGAGTLDRINKRHARFQTGGPVGMQEGGTVQQMAMPDLTQLNEIMQIFGNKVDLFAESLNNINGLEIQLVANHKVEIIVNGAQVLQGIMPAIQDLITTETNVAINNLIKSKFPDVGKMY